MNHFMPVQEYFHRAYFVKVVHPGLVLYFGNPFNAIID